MRNGFDKIDGLIRVYDKTRYLVLFGVEKYDFIYNRIRYLIGLKSDITYIFEKMKNDSDDDLPQEETLILHNVIILIKLVFQNHY